MPLDTNEIATELQGLRSRVSNLESLLIRTANRLDTWADESISGGWSTHQVEPMRKKADELRRAATRK